MFQLVGAIIDTYDAILLCEVCNTMHKRSTYSPPGNLPTQYELLCLHTTYVRTYYDLNLNAISGHCHV